MMDFDEWITTKEAAELTGYTTARFRQLAGSGVIAARKRGGVWFLKKSDALSWAREMRLLGTSKHDPWRSGARQRTN